MGITQITTCKGRLNDVELNLPHWLDSEIDQLILVDYGCGDNTAESIARGEHGGDRRINALRVPPEVAGPFFNVAAARNIGARLARHEWLLFVDADCRPHLSFWDSVRRSVCSTSGSPCADMIVSGPHAIDEDAVTSLPFSFQQDGQCLIRSYLFHEINGYNELNAGWGGESYDLYLRAAAYATYTSIRRCRVDYFGAKRVSVRAHSDELREKFQPLSLTTSRSRELLYSNRMRSLRRRRRNTYRAQPGKPFGIPATDSSHAKSRYPLFVGRTEQSFTPGEDF